MKNQSLKVTSVALICLVAAGCNIDSDFDDPVGDTSSYSPGSADFSNFVTIGDSLTAGYADGALYLSGQENSYPNILAQQFSKVGGGSFIQPLVNDNLGGVLAGAGNQILDNRLVLDAASKAPEPIDGTPTTDVLSFTLNGNEYNNMGVPGAKSFHLLSNDYGDPAGIGATANPYYVRFATNPAAGGSSVIDDAAVQIPSFFVMWIGNNDVLAYATDGGTSTALGVSADDITPTATFEASFNGLLLKLKAANSNVQGVLVNIPNVSTIPYFTTVPYNAVLLDQTTADALNLAPGFIAYNNGIAAALAGNSDEIAKRTISYSAGYNGVLIEDEDLTDLTGFGLPSMRHAIVSDLLVLTSSSKINTSADATDETKLWGITVPLEDADVLIASELEAIETARVAFNTTIKTTAENDENLIFFDVAAVMNELSTTGIAYSTGYVDNTYATGGAFSLDGVHPTARGYAVIANRMIKAINSNFGANIPPVDPNDYSTIFIK